MRSHSPPHLPRALTLVEVLAVLIILGLIAGTFMVGFAGTFGMARHELARTGLATLSSKVEVYHMIHGTLPTPDVGLAALGPDHAVASDPYYLRSRQLIDPWGHAYHLQAPGPDDHLFVILSYGADGRPGGEGEQRDLNSLDTEDSP